MLTWNIDGTFSGVFGDASRNDSGLHGPTGITFSPDESSFFVSSSKNNQVLEYDGVTGEFIGIFSDETAKVPDGLVLKPDGNLLVSSRSSGKILEYGELESKFYVSDWSGADNRILGLSDDGIITLNTNLDHLNLVNPQNIVADNLAKLWIVDAGPPSSLVQINPVSI
ncbi:SMP-30/gluconolactonase/LRE family protein, partial [candidate division KSB1 bacterium]|nr:SMP-30/gluconolactonase/LRE family protein [candidate division KSB1 bacterium]